MSSPPLSPRPPLPSPPLRRALPHLRAVAASALLCMVASLTLLALLPSASSRAPSPRATSSLSPLGAGAAFGHGLGGVATEVMTSSPDGSPLIVKLTTGLALKHPSGAWSFVCEARWGGDEAPLMAAASAAAPIWIAGADALYTLAADGSLAVASLDLSSATLRALASSPTSAHAVALATGGPASSGVALWRLDAAPGPRPWLTLPDPWTSAVADAAGLTLARATTDGTLWILTLPWDAASPSDGSLSSFPPPSPGARVSTLRQTPSALFVHSFDGASFSLSSLEVSPDQAALTPLATAAAPIFGPAQAQDTLWVLSDGSLGVLDPTAPAAAITWTPQRASCLSQHRDAAIICVLPDLWRMGASQPDAPIFRTADLLPPDLADLPDDAAQRCQLDWQHFAIEAGLDPAGPPPPTLPSDCTCQALRAGAPRPAAAHLLAASCLLALTLLCARAITRQRIARRMAI
jgi:hypothetical protein